MGKEVSRNKLLSHEETIELIKKAQSGNKEAKNILVTSNIGLVKSVLRGFTNRGHDLEDLFQIGCIGLLKAIEKFDLSFNVRFSTYAVPMIAGEIKRFLRDDGIIKVSRSLKQTANKVRMASERLTKKLGRDPTIEEISNEIGIDREEIVMALDSTYQPNYLYDVIYQSDGSPLYLIDKVGTDEEEEKDLIDSILLKDILGKLKPRDRQIIILRYFKDKTQVEVAEVLGISQVQVSRVEKRILNDIRSMIKEA